VRFLRRLIAGSRALILRRRVERDLDDELRGYLDASIDQKLAAGFSREESIRAARVELGGFEATKDRVRDIGWESSVLATWQDVSYALKGLRRAPGYALTAIAMIGLGIGANAAIFSIVDAAMIKPIPYREPQQLVLIRQVLRRGTAEQSFQIGTTWAQLDRWRHEPQIFSAIASFTGLRVPVDGPKGVARQWVSFVAPDVPALLGVRPILGRSFVADDVVPDAGVVLLSEDYWRSAFGRDPGVLGRTITVDSRRRTIVGVMPATLAWGVGGRQVVAWLPLDERSQRGPGGMAFVGSIARMRPGLTLESATAEMTRAIERVDAAVPQDRRYDADLMPLDSRALFDDMSRTRRGLTALWAAVGFVFLIACANVANLVLARVLDRRREIAVRAALGATRSRLFRQFFIEGLLVVVLGGLCAIPMAVWTARIVPSVVPSQLQLFDANPLALDRRTLAFCGITLAVAVLVCGLIPALRAVSGEVIAGLEGSPRIAGATTGARRLRVVLQAAQVALTLTLLTGAGLLAASFVRMVEERPGYDVDRLVAGSISLPKQRYPSPAAGAAFLETLLARLHGWPGLRATYGPPPSGGLSGRFVAFGHESERVSSGWLSAFFVEADYFAVAGIPLKSGRFFDGGEATAGAAVGVIDERAAALHWPGQSALGQRFRYSPYAPWVTIVGVAGHIKTRSFTAPNGTIQAWMPARFNPLRPVNPPLLARADGGADRALAAINSSIKTIDPDVQFEDGSPVADSYESVFREPRFFLTLMSLFAGLALLTASVGLYGLVNYAVAQRTREIGIRIALGADLGRVTRLMLRDAMIPVVIGLAGGLLASWWLSRFLSSLLFEVTPHDPGTFALVTMLLAAVAAVAAYVPARVATRIDPVATLRAE
jgi:putative ABC transport system permease protein